MKNDQCFSRLVPHHTTAYGPLELTGDAITANYFWIGRPDTIQQKTVRGLGGWEGFFDHRKALFGADYCVTFQVALLPETLQSRKRYGFWSQ